MDAPYRESAADDGKSYLPRRVLLQEHRWQATPKLLWACVPFVGILVWEIWTYVATPEVSRSETPFAMVMTFGLMLVSILYIVHRAYGGKSDAVRLFDDGVVMQKDGLVTDIRWDDVATITSHGWRDERGRLGQKHVLSSVRGDAITITHELEGIDALAAELERRVVRRVLPALVTTLRAGAKATFGDVRVERRGIAWGEHALVPWSEVACLEASHGDVTLRHAAGVERFERVPNAPVLVALAEQAMNEGGAARH